MTPDQAAGPLVFIYCSHGIDLRLTPRCWLCRPDTVEREAVAAALARVRERVEGLDLGNMTELTMDAVRDAVLAILDEEAGR